MVEFRISVPFTASQHALVAHERIGPDKSCSFRYLVDNVRFEGISPAFRIFPIVPFLLFFLLCPAWCWSKPTLGAFDRINRICPVIVGYSGSRYDMIYRTICWHFGCIRAKTENGILICEVGHRCRVYHDKSDKWGTACLVYHDKSGHIGCVRCITVVNVTAWYMRINRADPRPAALAGPLTWYMGIIRAQSARFKWIWGIY